MDGQKSHFDKVKFRGAILYLLAHSPNATIEGKKKLAKLLYFVDFNFFEAFEKPFTGATYRALPMGPFPKELEEILREIEGDSVEIKKRSTGLENDTVVYSLKKEFTFSEEGGLSLDEKKVLDKVLVDYGRMSGKMLENITHSEAPYNAVAQGEYMPYELAFYRGKTREELLGK